MIGELRKITISFISLGLGVFGILMIWGKYYYNTLWLVSCCLSVILVLGYMKSKIIHSMNKIQENCVSDFVVENTLLSYEEIMSNKYLMGNNIALFRYLDLLLDTCQIEKFIEVYMLNRRRLKSLFGREYLNLIVLKSSSLLRDRTEYEKRLKKYNFVDNNKIIGFSREIKDHMNLRDKMIRVRLLYEAREYKGAINLIDSIHSQSLWDQLYLQGERNKCLYHLKENCKFPKKEFSRYLVVKQWETLLSTGNEFYDEQISEVYYVMKRDVDTAYIRFYVYMTLAMVILGLIIITS